MKSCYQFFYKLQEKNAQLEVASVCLACTFRTAELFNGFRRNVAVEGQQ
jgi:hypothetical protein